jgi:hypothetical protein
MSSTATATGTETYSVADIVTVMPRFTADIVMIAQSSGGMPEENARAYAHDIELLAKKGYLEGVDVTLLSGSAEVCAVKYTVNTSSGELTMSRPGGVIWPRVANASVRVVVTYAQIYGSAEREEMKGKLKISWGPSYDDITHGTLTATGGRDYASNGWGLQRKDFSR